ncbi:unnamed protein product [Alopecurus aequalis]
MEGRRPRKQRPRWCRLPPQDEEDRLSALPDDVLLYILVKIDLKTAVKTSALSTRWTRLPWLLPKLNIDVKDFLPDFLPVPHLKPIEANLLHNAVITLTQATRSLLAKPRRESIITSLRLELDFVDTFSSDIGPLLCDAVGNGLLKDLDLAILDETRSVSPDSDMLKRGQVVEGFFRAYPTVLHCFTRLSLCDLRLVQSDMQYILFDHCRQLKHLTISRCDAHDCSLWKVDAPNSKLRVLEINICDGFDKIELISLPKLEKLDWDLWKSKHPLSFGFVPSLGELGLSNCFHNYLDVLKLSEFLHGTTGIHTLTLDFQRENIWIQPEIKQLTSVFSKLRKLSVLRMFVEFDLLWTTTFLEAAPCIEILHVGVCEHSCDEADRVHFPKRSSPRWELGYTGSKNLLLKELQIIGFKPLEQQLSFIKVILERAPNLQTVVLKEDRKVCKQRNAITYNVPLCASTHPAFPKNKDEQDMVIRRVTDGTFFSGRIVFGDWEALLNVGSDQA